MKHPYDIKILISKKYHCLSPFIPNLKGKTLFVRRAFKQLHFPHNFTRSDNDQCSIICKFATNQYSQKDSPGRWSIKKMFLKITQNWQGNICATASCKFIKKRLWHRVGFFVNFAKFRRTPFLQITSGWLLLYSST